MSLLAKLLLGDPGVENSQVEDLQIGREVELRTTAKKTEGCKPQCKQK